MSRQAYYQHWWRNESTTIEQELVLKQIIDMKKDHRHMGTRKLYELIQPFLLEHQIKMGRDALGVVLLLLHVEEQAKISLHHSMILVKQT